MADINNEIKVTFKGDNSQLKSSLGNLNKSLGRIQSSLNRTRNSMNALGTEAQKGFRAVSVAIGASVFAFSKFEKAMSSVSTLVDTTKESMDDMGAGVLKISKDVPVAIGDLTLALYDIRSAGIDASHAMKVLSISAKLGVAGLGSTKEATGAVTLALNTFGDATHDAMKISNLLFKTVKRGVTTISDIASGFGQVSGVAKEANISLEELQAATAAMTISNKSAVLSQTALRAAILSIQAPTEEMSTAIQNLGYASGAALLEQKGLVGSMDLLKEAADGNVDQLKKMYGRVEGLKAQLALTGAQADDFRSILADMMDDTNDVSAAFLKQKKTVASTFALMWNSFNRLAIVLGTKLAPTMKDLAEKFTKVASAIAEMDPKSIETIAKSLIKLAVGLGAIVIVTKVTGTILNITSALLALVAINPYVAAFAVTLGGLAWAFKELKKVGADTDFQKKMNLAAVTNEMKKLNTQLEKGRSEVGWFNKIKYIKLNPKEVEKATKRLKLLEIQLSDMQKGIDPKKGNKLTDFIAEMKQAATDLQTSLAGLKVPSLTDDEDGGDKDPSDNPISNALVDATEKVDPLQQALSDLSDFAIDSFKLMGDAIQDSWAETIDEWIKGGKTFGDFVTDLFQDVLDAFRQMVAKMVAMNMFKFLLSLIPGAQPFAFAMPSFDVGSSNVPADMVANVHKGEIIVPAKESKDIRSGNLALSSASKGQGQNNDLMAVLIAKVDNLAKRPIQAIMEVGEAQIDVLSKEITKGQFRVAEQGT